MNGTLNDERSQLSRIDEIALEREENQKLLREFIISKGGRITFEEFMWFNSFSSEGYYNARAKIGGGAGFDFQTYASNPLLALAYIECAKKVLNEAGRVLVEIAGGEGTLKKNALQYLREIASPAKYISIDISNMFARKQHSIDPLTIQATALHLPFEDSSLEGAIVANELLDALPLAVLSVRTQNEHGHGRMTSLKELYYRLSNNGEVISEWDEISQKTSDAIQIVQAAWAERGVFLDDFTDGQLVVFAPQVIDLIQELNRVMKSGLIMLTDYGSQIDEIADDDSPLYKRFMVRQFPRKRTRSLEDLPSVVFENDLTCDVDFTQIIYIANKYGLNDVSCRLYTQSDFCTRFTEGLIEHLTINPNDLRAEWFRYNNPIKTGDKWKALVISVDKKGMATVDKNDSSKHLATSRLRQIIRLLFK